MRRPTIPEITLTWNEDRMWWDVTYGRPNDVASFMKLDGALNDIHRVVDYWRAEQRRYHDALAARGK